MKTILFTVLDTVSYPEDQSISEVLRCKVPLFSIDQITVDISVPKFEKAKIFVESPPQHWKMQLERSSAFETDSHLHKFRWNFSRASIYRYTNRDTAYLHETAYTFSKLSIRLFNDSIRSHIDKLMHIQYFQSTFLPPPPPLRERFLSPCNFFIRSLAVFSNFFLGTKKKKNISK
jgi:hypothetical protein